MKTRIRFTDLEFKRRFADYKFKRSMKANSMFRIIIIYIVYYRYRYL